MAANPKVYKFEEVARHNAMKDCWLVILGKVYDVTEYMDDHPGGGEVLLSSSAKDATEEYEDAGHSEAAHELLKKYYIGDVDESTLPKINNRYVAPRPKQSSQDTSGGGDSRTKILQFLVPLIILVLALVVYNRSYAQRW